MRGMFAPTVQRESVEALVSSGTPSIQWNGSSVSEVPPNALIRYAWQVFPLRTSTMYRVWNKSTGAQVFQQAVNVNYFGFSWLDMNAPSQEAVYTFDGDYPNGPTIDFTVTGSAPNPNPGPVSTSTLLKYALIGVAAIGGTYVLVTLVNRRGK